MNILKLAWWKDLYFNQVTCRIHPQQKWLTKQIPRTWIDKDTLFELVILESIKHYVEKDHGLGFEEGDYESSQKDPEFPEHQKEFDREVKTNYDTITRTLPQLEAQLAAEWAKVPHVDWDAINQPRDYDATYGKVDQLEKEISEIKTQLLIWAVSKRASLWT